MSITPIQRIIKPDRLGDGTGDLTNALRVLEARVNVLERLVTGLLPTVRVVTSNAQQLDSDRVLFIDTTARAVNYVLLAPKDAFAAGFSYLRVKWIAGANAATITVLDGSNIDGATPYTFATVLDSIDLQPSLAGGAYGWWILGST